MHVCLPKTKFMQSKFFYTNEAINLFFRFMSLIFNAPHHMFRF